MKTLNNKLLFYKNHSIGYWKVLKWEMMVKKDPDKLIFKMLIKKLMINSKDQKVQKTFGIIL
jgi:hypothetical protein